MFIFLTFSKIDFRERGKRGRERDGDKEMDTDLLFHLLMHSLADCCMCPDWGPHPQPWHIGTTWPGALTTEPPGQGHFPNFYTITYLHFIINIYNFNTLMFLI